MMYSITIGKQTQGVQAPLILKRYKLQWRSWNGKRYYVKKTRVLHSMSLQDVKRRALSLFGIAPDNIQRI